MPKFESEIPGHPGSFEVPDDLTGRHIREWWKFAIEPAKGLDPFDYEFYNGDWLGAAHLIKNFGKWDMQSVPLGDLGTDEAPAAVKAWVTEKVSDYIAPFLPRSIRLKMSGII